MAGKPPFLQRAWDFVSGKDTKPSSAEVASALSKSWLCRNEIEKLFREQEDIVKRQQEVEKLTLILNNFSDNSDTYKKAFKRLKEILKF